MPGPSSAALRWRRAQLWHVPCQPTRLWSVFQLTPRASISAGRLARARHTAEFSEPPAPPARAATAWTWRLRRALSAATKERSVRPLGPPISCRSASSILNRTHPATPRPTASAFRYEWLRNEECDGIAACGAAPAQTVGRGLRTSVRKPCPTNLERQSGARFENEIEGSLRGAPKLGKAAIHDHGAQPAFARLCAQAQTDFLRARSRCANESRGRVVDPAHRIDVFLQPVVREWLDDHPGAVFLEGLPDVRRGADRITHVVQTVEHRDEIVIAARVGLRAGDFEANPVIETGLLCTLARAHDGRLMVVEADEFRGGVSLRHDDRGRAMSAAHIGDARAGLQFRLHPLQGR